jgi:hypothetical protein
VTTKTVLVSLDDFERQDMGTSGTAAYLLESDRRWRVGSAVQVGHLITKLRPGR